MAKKSAAKAVSKESKPAVKPAEKAKPVKAEVPKHYVVIDHPMDNEKLLHHHYVIRIGADWTGGGVEICIDNSEWQQCRHSVGYWWNDWAHIKAGEHTIAARSKDEKGKVVKKSAVHRCIY